VTVAFVLFADRIVANVDGAAVVDTAAVPVKVAIGTKLEVTFAGIGTDAVAEVEANAVSPGETEKVLVNVCTGV
jgi:hypothetical protein